MLALSHALETTDDVPCSFWAISDERFDDWLGDPLRQLFVVDGPDGLCGIGAYLRGGEFQDHLAELSIAVAPEARRHGVARAVLQSLEQSGRSAGIVLFKALVWVQNEPSRRFFERCGYTHRATLFSEFYSERFGEIDDCVYYKRLDGA